MSGGNPSLAEVRTSKVESIECHLSGGLAHTMTEVSQRCIHESQMLTLGQLANRLLLPAPPNCADI
jgi:hypothetical protein